MIDTVGTAVVQRVRALEAARAPEFREEEFVAPDPSWEPPYPYRAEELLLETHPPARPIGEMQAARSASVAVPTPGAAPDAPMTWVTVGQGDQVRFRDGEAGIVDHVLVDPETHEATHLVVRACRDQPGICSSRGTGFAVWTPR